MFHLHECSCYLFPEYRILFSSRLEQLIMGWWSEYSCLCWCLYKFHVFAKISTSSVMKLICDVEDVVAVETS